MYGPDHDHPEAVSQVDLEAGLRDMFEHLGQVSDEVDRLRTEMFAALRDHLSEYHTEEV